MASQYVDSTRTQTCHHRQAQCGTARAQRRPSFSCTRGLSVENTYRYSTVTGTGKKTTGGAGSGTHGTHAGHAGAQGHRYWPKYSLLRLPRLPVLVRSACSCCACRARPRRPPPLPSPLPSLPLLSPPLSKAHASPDRSAHQGSSLINKVPRIGTRLGEISGDCASSGNYQSPQG